MYNSQLKTTALSDLAQTAGKWTKCNDLLDNQRVAFDSHTRICYVQATEIT